MTKIWIEVAYAEPHKQVVIPLEVPQHTTVYDAAKLANLESVFPNLDIERAKMGVFSRLIPNPKEQIIEEGQRIEIYRALIMDPKQIRIKRAEKQSS